MKSNKFATIDIGKKKLKIALVQARFNEEITDALAGGAVKALKNSGLEEKDIEIHKVPGSFEIPIKCQQITRDQKHDGIIALGAVIRGETAHFDYVARAVTDGILRVMLDEDMFISFGVLTTDNLKQAQARSGNNQGNKGYEAALALLEMIQNH